MYRVQGLLPTGIAEQFGWFATQEEAELVAQEVLEEYADEYDSVTVVDSWGEVIHCEGELD